LFDGAQKNAVGGCSAETNVSHVLNKHVGSFDVLSRGLLRQDRRRGDGGGGASLVGVNVGVQICESSEYSKRAAIVEIKTRKRFGVQKDVVVLQTGLVTT
jgi:hypothetical protein